MKKIIFYSAIILLSFFTACDSTEKTEVKKEDPGTTEVKTEDGGTTVKEPVPNTIVDTTKRTSVSVGPGGADVKHKNTEVTVDKKGVKIGTRDVKVEIKK